MSALGAAALGYASLGWRVFPCVPRGKAPAGWLVRHGVLDATTDQNLINAWWAATPEANVAIACGTGSVDVLDVDVRPNGAGWPALNRAKAAGLLSGASGLISTPSGGIHLHYLGTEQGSSTITGQHLDLKATGGYVLMPPSTVVTERYSGTYTWLERRTEGARALDWAAVKRLLDPPPVAPMLRSYAGTGGSIDHLARWLATQLEGGRNRALFWAACRAVEEGHEDLGPLAAAAIEAGLGELEVARTVASARNRIRAGAAR